MVRLVPWALPVLIVVVRLELSHALSGTTGGGAAHPPPILSSTTSPAPWCHARIDFTAANEFITAHYNNNNNNNRRQQLDQTYFPVHEQDYIQPIYNAREGFWDPESGILMEPSLSQCGFQLLCTGDPSSTDKNILSTHHKVDWTNSTSIRQTYLPALEKAVRFAYEGRGGTMGVADNNNNNVASGTTEVEQVLFWCPTLRLEHAVPTARDNVSEATPQSGYVTTAHIDTCVDAYESLADLVHVVDQNRFSPGTTHSISTSAALVHALQDNHQRFAIVNAWRNIGTAPVHSAPLAFRPMRYHRRDTAFPDGVPDFSTSRWYTYPHLRPDEVLLFAQYDRDAHFPSDLWHCALTNGVVVDGFREENTNNIPARESFDVRCFVLLKDRVEKKRDRWSKVKSCQMDFEQSRDFCQEQAERRRQRL